MEGCCWRLVGGGLPGGKAAEGGVMKCERYAGGAPPLVGGGRKRCYRVRVRLPTCRLSGFPTCRSVGKSETWRVGGVVRVQGGGEGAGAGFWFTPG